MAAWLPGERPDRSVPVVSEMLAQVGGWAHDPAMVRLFDLEWRLSEIWAFASWLQGPHFDQGRHDSGPPPPEE